MLIKPAEDRRKKCREITRANTHINMYRTCPFNGDFVSLPKVFKFIIKQSKMYKNYRENNHIKSMSATRLLQHTKGKGLQLIVNECMDIC